MSESDSFIDEVSEEVRRDRLYATFRKYAWIPALIVVAIVGGAAANEYLKSRESAEAQANGDALLAALQAGSPAERAAALSSLPSSDASQSVLIKLNEAAALIDDDNQDAAFDVLKAAAETSEAEAAYTGLAALKAAMIRSDDPWSMATLERLSEPGGPYRLLALEQLGLAKVKAGDIEAALADFGAVLEDSGITAAMAQRVGQLVTALGGEIPSFAEQVSNNG